MKKLWMEDCIIRNNSFNFHLKPNLCDEMDVRERLIVQKLRNGDQDMIRI